MFLPLLVFVCVRKTKTLAAVFGFQRSDEFTNCFFLIKIKRIFRFDDTVHSNTEREEQVIVVVGHSL